MKLYKIKRGVAFNQNAIMIEPIVGNMDSFIYVSKLNKKVVELFGKGASLDTISTNFGVSFRYPDYKYNMTMAKLLIRIVNDEETFKKMKNGIG